MNIRLAHRPTISYYFPEIQNEFIDALGCHVKKTIIHDIKEAKYFALLLDSTPDVSHIDQMTVIIRYIK